jgi:hypothetical protein
MNILAQVLATNYPGAVWSLKGDTIDGLVWQDKVIVKPSTDDLKVAMEKFTAPPSLQDQINNLQMQVVALMKAAQAAKS